MSNTTLTAVDVKALADQIHVQADAMRIRSGRTARAYVVVGIVLVAYLLWAFLRIANFIEPKNLATTTGDIAVGQAIDLVGKMEAMGKEKAPELVRDAENSVVRAVPDFRAQLEKNVKTTIGGLVKTALEEGDKAMVDELAKIPDVSKQLSASAKNPDEASKLYAEVRKRLVERPDVKSDMADTMLELNKLRDHMRKLKDNHGLSPSERAERRMLQVVLAKVDLPKEPITAAAPAPHGDEKSAGGRKK